MHNVVVILLEQGRLESCVYVTLSTVGPSAKCWTGKCLDQEVLTGP